MMRKILAFLFVSIVSLYAAAQYDNTSFLLDVDQLESETFEGFTENQQGLYKIGEKEELKHFQISDSAMTFRVGHRFILPKQKALDKGFTFDGEKMYGIAPYNGVFYKEHEDSIFGIYYQTDHYFDTSKGDFVIQNNENYFIFTKEFSGYYSCEKLEFKKSKMIVSSIDHTEVMSEVLKLKGIYTKQVQGLKTYIASPSIDDLVNFAINEGFNDVLEYPSVRKL